jgi:hypothetical protein
MDRGRMEERERNREDLCTERVLKYIRDTYIEKGREKEKWMSCIYRES